jgi:hypothetical protein
MTKLKTSSIKSDTAEKRLQLLDKLFRTGRELQQSKVVFKGKLNPKSAW